MILNDMRIDRVTYSNFRNYAQFSLATEGNTTLIIGPNAVGKTNLIEGIQLTTALTSFRNSKTEHCIREGESHAQIETVLADKGRSLSVVFSLSSDGRTYFLNKKKKRTRDIRGILPAVLFCPDDLYLIKGSHSIKRTTLDALGSQLSANYHAVRKDYDKILRQKNHYLKHMATHEYLQSINEVVASIGAHLYCLRVQLLHELVPYIQQFYSELSQGSEIVDICYVPSWERNAYDAENMKEIAVVSRENARAALINMMEQSYHQEHDRRCSLFGPQVDHIEFYLNGRNARMFASQGQQRSLVLSYKMAEVALIADRIGYPPVLLLDDVMSELDTHRREKFMALLSRDIQTFITATHQEYFTSQFLQSVQVIKLGRDHV